MTQPVGCNNNTKDVVVWRIHRHRKQQGAVSGKRAQPDSGRYLSNDKNNPPTRYLLSLVSFSLQQTIKFLF